MNPDRVFGYGGRLHRWFITRRLRKSGVMGRTHAAVDESIVRGLDQAHRGEGRRRDDLLD